MAEGSTIRLLIADDNAAYRCALVGLFKSISTLEVVAEATKVRRQSSDLKNFAQRLS
jgi:hypothetical protein